MEPQYVSLSRVRISRSVRVGRFSARKPDWCHEPRKNLSGEEAKRGAHNTNRLMRRVISMWTYRRKCDIGCQLH